MKKLFLEMMGITAMVLMAGCGDYGASGQYSVLYFDSTGTLNNVLLKNSEDYIALCGLTECDNFNGDLSPLTLEQRAAAVACGIETLTNQTEIDPQDRESCSALANYYFESKSYKTAVHWAFKGAENGSANCMRVLAAAYKNGVGVVLDLEECIKWTYLGSALGDKYSREWLAKYYGEGMRYPQTVLMFQSAKQKAQQWVDQHANFFKVEG